MKLIDKDALVAEIENWKQHTLKCGYAGQGEYEEGNKQGRLDTCEKILSFLDSLDVKEVDLEKEIKEVQRYYKTIDEYEGYFATIYASGIGWIAKHFYELGLKTQNQITISQQRLSVLKMEFWTGLETFNASEMTLSDAYNQGVDDILEELGLKAQKGEKV